MLWLYIHFPCLQLDLSQVQKQQSEPFIIIDKNNNEVVQLNKAASEVGIKLGMGLASSISLSSDLKLTNYDSEIEEQELKKITEHLYLLTGDISLDPPKGMFIKVSPMLKLYSSPDAYWHSIQQTLLSFNVTIHYALTHSATAAKLLAVNKVDQLSPNKEICLELCKTLPIEALLISGNSKKSLQHVGIKTLGQLLDIPLKELAIRFDIELINYIGKLTGELKEKLSYYQQSIKFEKTLELLFEIENTAILIRPLTKLLKELETFLTLRCLATQELTFVFKQANKKNFSLTIQSAVPKYQADDWAYLLSLKLEKTTINSPVRTITIQALNLATLQSNTNDLFSNNSNSLNKNELLSILQAKLGDDCVYLPTYKAEHLPENNTLLEPVNNRFATTYPKIINGLRPAHILLKPQPLKEHIDIQQAAERIQTAWWQSNIDRDYFLATNINQQLIWVFRRPDNKWFIHGYFG